MSIVIHVAREPFGQRVPHEGVLRDCRQHGFLVTPLRISNTSTLGVFGEGDYTVTMGPNVIRTRTKLATVANERDRSSKAHGTMDTMQRLQALAWGLLQMSIAIAITTVISMSE